MNRLREPPEAQVVVSIVTYNGERWLPGCLASLRAQTLPDFEVRVFDNGSSDDSVQIARAVARVDRRFSVRSSMHNFGFAGGHNRNLATVSTEFVVTLNQDAELDRLFLERALGALAARPAAASLQPLVLVLAAPGKRTKVIDTSGLEMARTRRVVSRWQAERESPRHLVPGPIWGADGPIAALRMSALREIGEPRGDRLEVFDETFFMYKEDVDLAWRLRRAGWQAWYEPGVVGWHARDSGAKLGAPLLEAISDNWSIPLWIRAKSWRNHRLMMLKNEQLSRGAGGYAMDRSTRVWCARLHACARSPAPAGRAPDAAHDAANFEEAERLARIAPSGRV